MSNVMTGALQVADPSTSQRSNSLRWLIRGSAILLAVLLFAFFTPGARDGGGLAPYDPESPLSDGTKGLVNLLGELGSTVQISERIPATATSTPSVLVIFDRDVTQRQQTDLARAVRDGATLIVADPGADFAGIQNLASATAADLTDFCNIPALKHVGEIDPGNTQVFEPELRDSDTCYTVDSRRGPKAFVSVQARGDGKLITVGTPAIFTNKRLESKNNAAFAVALIAPVGDEAVTIIKAAPPEAADKASGKTLAELVPTSVKYAIIELCIATLLLAIWRARRFGRPIIEDTTVEIAGSQATVGLANLLQKSRRFSRAANAIRADFRTELVLRLGLPRDVATSDLAEVAATRLKVGVDELLWALRDGNPHSEERLVSFAQFIQRLRSRLLLTR